MTDVRRLLAEANHRLADRVDAETLLLHLLGKSRSWLIAHATDEMTPEVVADYAAWVERRACGEPVAYITGRRDFWSLELEVTPATLIPRPETERLVELALERLPLNRVTHVADLGTGSGAIALAIARERPLATIVATDASEAALDVARRNATRHHLERITFLHANWMSSLQDRRFDLIVSNPPYIEDDDLHLEQGDLRFEPASALASGADGLNDIRQIVAQAITCLRPGGWLLLEHGWHQADAVRVLLERAGYVQVFTARDLEQRDRVTGGRVNDV